jgi:NADPH-ferrihemoprotein reductase
MKGKVAPTVFFYGCRDPSIDYLYKEEIGVMCDEAKYDLNVVNAFSRVKNEEKVYVQKRIEERKDEVWELLKDGAYFYVCGDAKNMAVAVHHALEEIAGSCGGMDEGARREWVKELKTGGRYLEDTWS